MLVHCGAEAGFVYVQTLLPGDVAGNLEGQTVGGVQVEGFAAIEDSGASTTFACRLTPLSASYLGGSTNQS